MMDLFFHPISKVQGMNDLSLLSARKEHSIGPPLSLPSLFFLPSGLNADQSPYLRLYVYILYSLKYGCRCGIVLGLSLEVSGAPNIPVSDCIVIKKQVHGMV